MADGTIRAGIRLLNSLGWHTHWQTLSDKELAKMHTSIMEEVKRREETSCSLGDRDQDYVNYQLYKQNLFPCETCEKDPDVDQEELIEKSDKCQDIGCHDGMVCKDNPDMFTDFKEEIEFLGGTFLNKDYAGDDGDELYVALKKCMQQLGGDLFWDPTYEHSNDLGLIVYVPVILQNKEKKKDKGAEESG